MLTRFEGMQERSVHPELEAASLDDWVARSAVGTPQSQRLLTSLTETLQDQIIPALARTHAATVRSRRIAPAEIHSARTPSRTDVEHMTDLVVSREAEAALAFARTLNAEGVSLPVLYLELLAPVARRLGEFWVEDRCTFADVTLGLCRLHKVVRVFSPRFCPAHAHAAQSRTALLLPAPGEQHMFGAMVVAEFVRRAGWEVTSGPALAEAELLRFVRTRSFVAVGLSASTDRALEALPRQIARLRERSANPSVQVLVGGWRFTEAPELASRVGADGTANDAGCAALQMEHRLAMIE